ncbi:MAG: UvrB/UvrC motif-containing protein [Solirubrobacteraceae bacterium]
MLAAADELRFEYAARLRDEVRELKRELDAASANAGERTSDVGSAPG